MAELSSGFSREDIETLIEAVGDWEMMGNQDYHILTAFKRVPMPPEDHESYETIRMIKEHYQKREREIKEYRDIRQERAVLLKARLMLTRRDLGIGKLFDMAATAVDTPAVETRAERQAVQVAQTAQTAEPSVSEAEQEIAQLRKRLERAEYYIKDLSPKVFAAYQEWLAEQSTLEE